MDFTVVKELLEELDEELDDPKARYELELMEEHYHQALREQYIEKEDGRYDF